MSDERIRRAEREYCSNPCAETALALGRERSRGGESGIRVFRILEFVKELKSWKLAVSDLEQPQMRCVRCAKSDKPGYSTDYGRSGIKCAHCVGTALEPFDEGGPFCLVGMREVNKLFPYLSRGFIVGRWRETPTGLLKWVGS